MCVDWLKSSEFLFNIHMYSLCITASCDIFVNETINHGSLMRWVHGGDDTMTISESSESSGC